MIAILHTLRGENHTSRLYDHDYIKEVILLQDEESTKRFLKFTNACLNDVEDIQSIYSRLFLRESDMMLRFMFTVPKYKNKDAIYIDEYIPIDVRNGWSARNDPTELFRLQFKRYKYGLIKCLTGETGFNILSLEPSLDILEKIGIETLTNHSMHASDFVHEWINKEEQENE